jgi:hypothetical protein
MCENFDSVSNIKSVRMTTVGYVCVHLDSRNTLDLAVLASHGLSPGGDFMVSPDEFW